MALTQELRKLIELKSRSPHALLGLHVLSDGSGLVARAIERTGARGVSVAPKAG